MKILRIRFQNLNSLSGTWDIRFTDPAYAENNIFAITGPTGAGKTTLLDGICLALYGATPRLGKITKSSNEIISRHTGLCFAEVEFSTTKGTYRCHWSQHRSRNKANGELQQPKHEIADALSGTILESRIRNVAAKVEDVTGMDFDRFTRSTLLAQGGFAAFLQASANERAPILEQITGTEIYSQLSMKVHELQGVEQQKLNKYEQDLSHIDLLPPEVEEELNIVLIKTEKESLLCKTKIDSLRTQQSWLETIDRLTSEKNVYLEKLDLLVEETEKKRDELGRLQPALAAKSIEPHFHKLNTLLENENTALQEQNTLEKSIVDLAEKQQIRKKQTEEATKVLHKAEHSRETGLLLIKTVEALDHTIKTIKKSLNEQFEKLSKKRTLQKKEDEFIASLKHSLLQKQKDQTRLENFFTQNFCDKQLIEDLEAIRFQISTLNNLQKQHCAIANAEEKVKKAGQKSHKTVTQLSQAKTKLQKETDTTKTNFDRLQEAINQILKGRDSSSLQQTLFRTRNRQKSLKDLLDLISRSNGQRKKLSTLQKEIIAITEQKAKTEEKHTICERKKGDKEKEIALLEKNVRLLIKIQALEEDRKQLQDDTPCPLCGSKHHPYNHGNIPEVSQEELLLQNSKSDRAKISEELVQLARNCTIAEEKLHNCSRQEKEFEGHIEQSKKEVQQLLSELELPALKNVTPEQLDEERSLLVKEQQQLEHDSHQLEKLNKDLTLAGTCKEKLQQTGERLERDILEATHNSAALEQKEQSLTQEAEKISEELVSITDELSQKTHEYRIGSITTENLHLVLKELEQRAKQWKENKEESDQIAPQIITLISELGHKETFYQNLTEQIDENAKKFQLTQDESKKMVNERADLFGKKEPIHESQKLEQEVKDARRGYDKLLQEYAEIEKKVIASQALLNRLQKEIITRKCLITKQEDLFNQILAESCFSSSQEFLDARIASQELNILQELHNKLQRRKAEIQALHKDKEIALQLERTRQLTKESTKDIKKQINELEKQQESVYEKHISLKEQLKTNTTFKTKSKDQMDVIASQKRVLSRWNRLHMLIGSADGKKFRNFAQGLTFEMMVHHANVHLQKMNNRYILVRDLEHPLDLNVIDTYQADEIRSTKNLSGGESFLVSLALALGLSRMASQNVRVDSLFLDEGFGTLDEDALESALDTLAGLRDENKLIGIISHVVALKERIPLQIEIIPKGNGNSRIKGPGVTLEIQ